MVVFGPNDVPFAFNGISGGDFTAGCPVIAKAHPLHLGTSKLLAECATRALETLPKATVQMFYNISNENGLRLVSDIRVGASSFTGSKTGGSPLKSAADATAKVTYLEVSSLHPVILLPGAIAERFGLVQNCPDAARQLSASSTASLAPRSARATWSQRKPHSYHFQ